MGLAALSRSVLKANLHGVWNYGKSGAREISLFWSVSSYDPERIESKTGIYGTKGMGSV